ncbi:MAG: MFS transporter, partial [Ralstonia sp.]|nr:MFS transporter [Ralstonia sp.]
DFTLIPQGSSAVNFLRQLGGAIGVSATGIFLQWRLATRGIETVHGAAVDPDARILAFDETFVFLGTLCALAVLAAWRMRRRALPSVIPAAQ